MSKKYKHWCGSQGYGLGLNDVCPACYANELRRKRRDFKAMSEKEIEKAVAEAIRNA